jgi:outer membrane protein, heavy metal efflux system
LLSKKKKKGIFFSVLLLTSCVLPAAPGLSSTNESDTLSGYLEQALTGNDALRMARAEFRVSTERSRLTGVYPDPKLVVQYYLQPVETRTGPQNAAIGISQSVPWFNKLSLLHELSNHETAIAAARLAAVELDVSRKVKEAYIEYGFLGRSQQTVADNIELLRYLEGVARSRYSAGKVPFFDVLKIQIELAKTEEKALALADKAYPLRIHINSLLGIEAERDRPIPETLPQVILEKEEDVIHSLSLRNAPLLQTARQRIAKARTGKELAEKDFFPDFNFSLKTILTGSAEYGNPPDSGRDPIIAGLNVNLPVFRDRRHAKVAEQEAGIRAAQSFQQEQMRLLETQIEQDLYAYREAQRKLVLYRDELLPKVKQQLEVAVNGFQSGENSILELIDAEQNLLTFGLAEKRALADRALAVARLESRAGAVLGEWE